MESQHVISIIEKYETKLSAAGIPKERIDPTRTFQSLSISEILAHAHFICDGVKEYARDPTKQRKTGSHLTVVQMCLSFAGWYTLEDLMTHNRSISD